MSNSKIAQYWRNDRAQSPEEKRLVRKLDLSLLPIMCLMYWSMRECKDLRTPPEALADYLNRTNYQFAYVSGMAQDLNFVGNDFGKGNTIFTVGYTVFQIPHTYLVTLLPARFYFPACCLLWGGLGAALSGTQTVQQVWAIRFLISMFEAVTFAGSHYLLHSWYTSAELGKRAALFASSAQLGSLFSGVLQGAIHDNLNGVGGRAGWRWAYLIDGIIAMGIALVGFAVFPSTPAMSANWIFSEEEIKLAKERLPKRDPTPITPRNVFHIVWSYKYIGFCVLFTVGSQLEAYGTNGVMPLWLASLRRYSVSDNSYYALGLTAWAIVITWLVGILTDIYGRRWMGAIPMFIGMTISASIILAYDVPIGALFFAFYLGGTGYIQQGVFFAWANEAGTSDLERSVTLFSMNMWSNALTAWWILIFWPATSAPRFRKGMISTLVIAPLVLLWAAGLRFLELRERRKKREEIVSAPHDVETEKSLHAEKTSEGEVAHAFEDMAVKDPRDPF